ncbi:uncharacterized protein LOC110465854 [Mizuhopecten yessoensis]|uniref:Protein mab-21-like n=1 Tax=Mizuhopecten yessoensis TaxID=6573 RepID=A0A210PQN9_MIZYE|nr:uncharacterized protein LOC110465854 [Mizuhopecten yessoensis]OWF38803.1 Protein mab-21-like [Mizuhopecten yessoensis]
MEMFDSMCRSSMYLSGLLNIVTGREDELALKRKVDEMMWYPHDTDDLHRKYFGGSRSEGLWLPGSDMDIMMVVRDTVVLSLKLGEHFKKYFYHHILIMRDEGCRPGHVVLQVGNISVFSKSTFQMAIVKHKGLQVVSSSAFRSKLASLHPGVVEHGPCASILDNPDLEVDLATAFHCPEWPDIARDWITRSRPHGWPTAAMIDNIVKQGCHVVPVGDKTSENVSVEWRVSFARAERSLVHSLNHLQFKLYTLLKLFLKQVINKHEEVRDLISSYFLKTVVFFVAENTPKQLWSNGGLLFINYQNCLKMLTQWVREGHCPNYFVPKNNMFLGRVFGKGQENLANILDSYCSMGMEMLKKCEYFENLNTTPSMKDLVELELVLRNAKEAEFRKDMIAFMSNTLMYPVSRENGLKSVRRALKFFGDSEKFEDENSRWILLLNTLLGTLSLLPDQEKKVNSDDEDTEESKSNETKTILDQMETNTNLKQELEPSNFSSSLSNIGDHNTTPQTKCDEYLTSKEPGCTTATTGLYTWKPSNKERYRELRRCKYSLAHCTQIDVSRGWLTLATFLYMLGSYNSALKILQLVKESYCHFTIFKSSSGGIVPNQDRDNAYKKNICIHGLSLRNKTTAVLSLDIFISETNRFCPEELQCLVEDTLTGFHIPPLPYAAFATFLCFYHLGDLKKQCQALDDLQMMMSHNEQGAHLHPVVYNLVGLCLELTGDTSGAIDQYTESLRRRPAYNGANKRLKELGVEIIYQRPLQS